MINLNVYVYVCVVPRGFVSVWGMTGYYEDVYIKVSERRT